MNVKLTPDEAMEIATIIIMYSVIDDALCNFIIDCPLDDGEVKEAILKIKDNRSNVGIGDKINIVTKIFPNNPIGGKKCINLKGSLIEIKNIRVKIAHGSRYYLGDEYRKNMNRLFGSLPGKIYQKGEELISVLYKNFERNFNNIRPLVEGSLNDWDYRDEYLYGISHDSY